MPGRARDPNRPNELRFGPFRRIFRESLHEPRPGTQWTGITARIGERRFETGLVRAVLALPPAPGDPWRPQAVVAVRPEDTAHSRGMGTGYAPTVALLEPAIEAGLRRLAPIGVPCKRHALPTIEAELGLERLRVAGAPCSDHTTTERFGEFLALFDSHPETTSRLEFRAHRRVEPRDADRRVRPVPFLEPPLAGPPADFFPLTGRTCADWSDVLADVTDG